jgi:hypothetical protein
MSKKSKLVSESSTGAKAESFVIEPPKRARCAFEIVGETSYIQNAFSQKAIEEMLRKHMGLTVQREKKNPRQVIENAIIRNVKGAVSVPPVSVKCAMLTAASGIKTFQRAKTQLKTGLFIVGSSLPLTFERMVPRMHMVRTAGMGKTPDVRFRPEFQSWSTRLIIEYSDTLLQPQSIADLLQRAGNVGIGEWRPERMGTFGTFYVSRALSELEEIAEVEAACKVPLKTPEIPEWALDANIDMTMLAKIFSSAGDGEGGDEDKAAE